MSLTINKNNDGTLKDARIQMHCGPSFNFEVTDSYVGPKLKISSMSDVFLTDKQLDSLIESLVEIRDAKVAEPLVKRDFDADSED